MRFTIERIRTLVLAAGAVLVVVLAAFLAIGKWKNPFNRRDIPKRLGIDIQQESNGVTYTQARGGQTIFKIHASKVIQLTNDHATLHGVLIEIYGHNGSGVDRIQGDEFDYDQKTGILRAAGPAQIALMPPAASRQTVPGAKTGARPQPATGAGGEIDVKTSGLAFDRQTGIASTQERVDFSSQRSSGSSIGASYDSDSGVLILDRAVELTTRRGANPVVVHAGRAEFDRNPEIGHLRFATAETGGQRAAAAVAQIYFRADGSVERLDGSGGVTVSTAAGSRLTAPRGSMIFSSSNRPRSGRFEGGVTLESNSQGRQMSGTSPLMNLAFDSAGELRRAHLERGVQLRSHEQAQKIARGGAVPVQVVRTWHSPLADLDFRQAGAGQVEPARLHGWGGVVMTGETRAGSQPPVPSRLAADDVTAEFGPRSTLISAVGIGHAGIEQTTATGVTEAATGDRLQARFVAAASAPGATAQIQSAQLDGNVTLMQKPAPAQGAQSARPQPPLRATAGHADYQAAGQWLRLTISPRVEQGGMQLTADRVDFSQASEDAFAHGDVKATWMGDSASGAAGSGSPNAAVWGGKGPVHAIAADAELHQPTGKTTLLGNARMWQQENSIAAPIIVIFRQSQTLVARTTDPAEPVITVLQGAAAQPASSRNRAARPGASSLVRVRGGDLWYSGAERKAIMRAAPLAAVTAQSAGVESSSTQVELFLAPPGTPPQAGGSAPAQVERMNALGHVVLTSQDRRGVGEKLVYISRTSQYVLTGTASAPPRLSDPRQGSVTGAALIFNSRDDSVSIEGGGHATTTADTAAPH